MSRFVTIGGFAALGLAMVLVTVRGHSPESRLAPPSAVLERLLARRPIRVAVLLFWWWAGWHFLVEP